MQEKERIYEDVRYEIKDLKKAFLVGVYFQSTEKRLCEEHLEELAQLSKTYGFTVAGKLACPLKKISASMYLGEGKVQEILKEAEEAQADVIILDEEISPNQERNLEKIIKKPILDRTELILEVFAQRAQTKEARLQIELAKSRYQLPRLKRLWTHLSRQAAGGGGAGGAYLRGAGERQIEIDRRLIKNRISRLQKELKEVKEQRHTQRQARMRSGIPTLAIVGYTNAGKSTLLNSLTNAGVLTEDKLFATLDTTTRKYLLPNHQEILLIDTVGFIRKLPHTVVAAFKSTLEEVIYTDVLIHLIDVSHPMAVEQAETTYQVLKELHAIDRPIITVLNKIDALEDKSKILRFRAKYPKTVAISAKTQEGFEDLLKSIMKELRSLRSVYVLRIPQKEYALVSKLMEEGVVLDKSYEENDVIITIELPKRLEHQVQPYLQETKTGT
ncbi:MAG: GTPase HflX [Simkaniaceae bacterium]